MSRRQCWTCNSEHDLDAPCGHSASALSARAMGATSWTPFGGATEKYGHAFLATYDGYDSCCGEGIVEGESVRADGEGGWIHANGECDQE